MEIKVKIKYEEEYLPTKRHRIPRIREKEEMIKVNLREVMQEDAPLAMIVTDYKSYIDENGENLFGLKDSKYLAIDNHLYSEKRDMSGALDRGPCCLTDFIREAERHGDCYYFWSGKTKEEVLRSLESFINSHALIDGVIYEKRNEPRYVINTFGLGHNHGGTGMFIENNYNPNISKDSYFNALERDEAIAYANKVAERRGDTESIGTFGKKNIKVYMPEMVRCTPNIEHGNGNPFLNFMEDLVAASDSSFEAGILAMAATSALADNKQSLDDKINNAAKRSAESETDLSNKTKNIER